MIAVVTIAAGRHDHLRRQLTALRGGSLRPARHIVVAMGDPRIREVCREQATVIDVALVEGRLPLAAARNAGAQNALDHGADHLVFLDVDCIPAPAFLQVMSGNLDEGTPRVLSGRVGYLPPPPTAGYRLSDLMASAREHPARAVGDETIKELDHTRFWSLCFGLNAQTWTQLGGFDAGYTGYGGEDTDFGERARVAGVAHRMLADAWVYHQWHASCDPPTNHLDDILRNARRFRDRWGYWPMLGWLERFVDLGLVRHDPARDDWARTSTASPTDPDRSAA